MGIAEDYNFFVYFLHGVRLRAHLILQPLFDILCQLTDDDDDDCGGIREM
jgi:hypothetical protein